MKIILCLFVTLFSTLASASQFSWDAVVTMRLAQTPAVTLNCGERQYKIGGDEISSDHLVYALKSSPITCTQNHPRVMNCSFDVALSDNDDSIVPYTVSFHIARGPKRTGPQVDLEEDLFCVKKQ